MPCICVAKSCKLLKMVKEFLRFSSLATKSSAVLTVVQTVLPSERRNALAPTPTANVTMAMSWSLPWQGLLVLPRRTPAMVAVHMTAATTTSVVTPPMNLCSAMHVLAPVPSGGTLMQAPVWQQRRSAVTTLLEPLGPPLPALLPALRSPSLLTMSILNLVNSRLLSLITPPRLTGTPHALATVPLTVLTTTYVAPLLTLPRQTCP
mmetsp:Transcript_21027/g.41241  ORF Transcript_21027/g.41241 Transcript_21027/m.41241 type:complete len:206 (+) Transcript_21027:478-1095(+)